MTQLPTSQPRSPLEDLLESLPHRGWHLHNLYQGRQRWEARLKALQENRTYLYSSYCGGVGSTAFEAIESALADGEARKNWHPRSIPELPRKEIVTTDDIMGDLDL